MLLASRPMTPEQADHLIAAINQLAFVLAVGSIALAFGLVAVTIAIHRRRQAPINFPAVPPHASGDNRSSR